MINCFFQDIVSQLF